MLRDILNDLIDYGELTRCSNRSCYLNKYKSNWKIIDEELFIFFITSKLIQEDSGNFETGEIHYIINNDDNYKLNRIERIDILIKNVNKYLYFGDDVFKELIIMKKIEERKLKLKKVIL